MAAARENIGAERITIPLFAYGTLGDRETRIALFGSEVERCAAELPGHRLLSKDGFLLVGEAQGRVGGVVLFLNGAQLAIADLWEEVPFYSRSVRRAFFRGSSRLAWVYSRSDDGAVAPKTVGSGDTWRERVLGMARDLGLAERRRAGIFVT